MNMGASALSEQARDVIFDSAEPLLAAGGASRTANVDVAGSAGRAPQVVRMIARARLDCGDVGLLRRDFPTIRVLAERLEQEGIEPGEARLRACGLQAQDCGAAREDLIVPASLGAGFIVDGTDKTVPAENPVCYLGRSPVKPSGRNRHRDFD